MIPEGPVTYVIWARKMVATLLLNSRGLRNYPYREIKIIILIIIILIIILITID